MSVDWYWLNPDKTVRLGPDTSDPEAFKEYSDWLYGNENGVPNNRVAYDRVGGYGLSTVFLGLDHSHGGGPPVLFESMLFGLDGKGIEAARYETYQEAVDNHNDWVRRLKEQFPELPLLDAEFTLEEIEQSQILLSQK